MRMTNWIKLDLEVMVAVLEVDEVVGVGMVAVEGLVVVVEELVVVQVRVGDLELGVVSVVVLERVLVEVVLEVGLVMVEVSELEVVL